MPGPIEIADHSPVAPHPNWVVLTRDHAESYRLLRDGEYTLFQNDEETDRERITFQIYTAQRGALQGKRLIKVRSSSGYGGWKAIGYLTATTVWPIFGARFWYSTNEEWRCGITYSRTALLRALCRISMPHHRCNQDHTGWVVDGNHRRVQTPDVSVVWEQVRGRLDEDDGDDGDDGVVNVEEFAQPLRPARPTRTARRPAPSYREHEQASLLALERADHIITISEGEWTPGQREFIRRRRLGMSPENQLAALEETDIERLRAGVSPSQRRTENTSTLPPNACCAMSEITPGVVR